jgi:hypothetical protein
MTESADPHVWMIRTTENVLSGPYTQSQLVQLIEEEKLELTDEICRGNGYWIYLHEEQEVKKQLGIEVPAALVQFEEPTQTETDTILLRASQEARDAHARSTLVSSSAAAMGTRNQRNSIVSNHSESSSMAAPQGNADHARGSDEDDENDDRIPELSVSADSIEDHSSVLSNRAFREFRPVAQDAETPPTGTEVPSLHGAHTPPVVEVNGVSLVDLPKGGRWILILFSCLVAMASVYLVYRRLRH